MKALTALLISVYTVISCPAVQPNAVVRGHAPDSAEWHREAKGFGATVLITPDLDWKQKCTAPTAALPDLERTNSVHIGGKVWAVVLLSNPLPDGAGKVDVTCDFRLVRPNGRISKHCDLRALQGRLDAPTSRFFLSEFVLTMDAEESDPLGEWVMELVIHDRNRGVEVPIVGRYTVLPKQTRR
ncbi:MAG: hypothetical protein IPL39_07355 [Opitutaceae bacterium]|nr:hypothetical protein [Opitutaceae bacterium]